jgi:hypothetical protein
MFKKLFLKMNEFSGLVFFGLMFWNWELELELAIGIEMECGWVPFL